MTLTKNFDIIFPGKIYIHDSSIHYGDTKKMNCCIWWMHSEQDKWMKIKQEKSLASSVYE